MDSIWIDYHADSAHQFLDHAISYLSRWSFRQTNSDREAIVILTDALRETLRGF